MRCLDCRHCGKVKGEQLDFLADNPIGHAQQLIRRLTGPSVCREGPMYYLR